MAVEDLKSSPGTVKTGLRENAIGIPGILMQGIATIAPSFAILASFVFIVTYAGLSTPWAYLFGGVLLGLQALNAAQLAKVFPSAGCWYTWIARSLHPRAGFFAGWYMTLWLPFAPALVFSYLATTVLSPVVLAEYGINIPVWVWTTIGVGTVAWTAYRGIRMSERVLIVTGLTEMLIMIALAAHGFASPGPGGKIMSAFSPSQDVCGGLRIAVSQISTCRPMPARPAPAAPTPRRGRRSA